MLFTSVNLNDTQKQIITVINSTFIFILAYFTVYSANLIATAAAASHVNIPTILFMGHIDFKIIGQQWEQNDVITTYATGPVLCLLLAIAFNSLFSLRKTKRGLLKVYFLWSALIGFNLFFGSLIAGTVVRAGFWYAVRWMLISDVVPIFIALIFLVVLIAIGVYLAPSFLFATDSLTLIQFNNRNKLIISTVFLPWIFGCLLISLFKVPDLQLYELLQFLTLGIMLIPIHLVNQNVLFDPVVKEPFKTKMSWVFIILALAVALLFRLMLQNGLEFGF